MWKTNCHIFYMYLATGLIDFYCYWTPAEEDNTYLPIVYVFPFFPFCSPNHSDSGTYYPVRTSLPCSIPSLRCRRNFRWSSADGVSHFSTSFFSHVHFPNV